MEDTTPPFKGSIGLDYQAHMRKLEMKDDDILHIAFSGEALTSEAATRFGEIIEKEFRGQGIKAHILVTTENQKLETLTPAQLEQAGLVSLKNAPPKLRITERLLLLNASEFTFQGDCFACCATLNHPIGEGWAVYYEGPDSDGEPAENGGPHKLWLMEKEGGPMGSHVWRAAEDEEQAAYLLTFEELEDAVNLAIDYATGRKTAPGQWNHYPEETQS